MACSNCMIKFTFFKKEHGCDHCGFSFCSRCCSPQSMPGGTPKHLKLCKKCSNISRKSPTTLEKPPISSPVCQVTNLPVDMGQSKEDNIDGLIQSRLNKLKGDNFNQVKPSTEEIEMKLAALKGVPNIKPCDVQLIPKKKNEEEEVSNLLDEIKDEVEIDGHYISPEVDVQQRLDKLKGLNTDKKEVLIESNSAKPALYARGADFQNPKSLTNQNDLDEVEKMMASMFNKTAEDAEKSIANLKEDEEVNKYMNDLMKRKERMESDASSCGDGDSDAEEDSRHLMAKILQEANLDSQSQSHGIDRHFTANESKSTVCNEVESEELPWCSICNNDAVLRCLDCDDDLYCKCCFKHCHDEFDLKTHKTVNYKPSK